MTNTVLLLNSDYSPLGIIPWQKAIKLWSKGKIEIIKSSKKMIRNFEQTFELLIPEIIRLVKFVRDLWKTRVPFSKRTLLIRDNFSCQYCGCDIHKGSSIDHIIPKSKGGKSNFENCVSACVPCNNRKDDRLPSVAKMYPKNKPFTPTINQFISLSLKGSNFDETLKELGIY